MKSMYNLCRWIGLLLIVLPVLPAVGRPGAGSGSGVPDGGTAAIFAAVKTSTPDARAETFALGPDPTDIVASRLRRLSAIALDEVVWLARCIYSESDRAHEQELVAWVVRNRVETHYRGTTYRQVVLEANQFSAFNAPSKRRQHILNLDHQSSLRPWRRALKIALDVYQAPGSRRPFPKTVRHFYSPVSMAGGRAPHWADGDKALASARLGVDRRRFIFFNDVDERLAAGENTPKNERNVVRNARYDGDDSGFKLKLRRPSGKVSRPRRPSVQTSRFSRGK